MLYGFGCGVVVKFNCLITSIEMMFFWLSLSTIKCSGVPFTHICEWKSCSPSSGSSSSWIVVIAIVLVGSTSMICLLLLFSESYSESGLGSVSLRSSTNDYFERHSSVLCQGILWKSHNFLVSFFSCRYPSFPAVWTSGLEDVCSMS